MARRKATARVQVPVRMLEAMRAKLEKAAKVRGTSLNAEIVHRLNASLTGTESFLTDVLGSSEKLLFALLIGHAIRDAEEKTGHGWLDDDATYDRAVKAIIAEIRPSGKIPPELKVVREAWRAHFRRFQ